MLLGEQAEKLQPLSAIVLRLLGALATPLIFLAVVHALVKADIRGVMAARMVWLLLFNTLVAICVGLFVANLLQPGRHAELTVKSKPLDKKPYNLVDDLMTRIPSSALRPLVENEILGVIFVAVATGIGLRVVRSRMRAAGQTAYKAVEDLLDTGVQLVMVVLHWIVALVPLAVFAVVAHQVGAKGLAGFVPMLWFVAAVLLALTIQAAYYLTRLWLGSWVSPLAFPARRFRCPVDGLLHRQFRRDDAGYLRLYEREGRPTRRDGWPRRLRRRHL